METQFDFNDHWLQVARTLISAVFFLLQVFPFRDFVIKPRGIEDVMTIPHSDFLFSHMYRLVPGGLFSWTRWTNRCFRGVECLNFVPGLLASIAMHAARGPRSSAKIGGGNLPASTTFRLGQYDWLSNDSWIMCIYTCIYIYIFVIIITNICHYIIYVYICHYCSKDL